MQHLTQVTLFCSSCLYTVQNIMNVQTLISYTAQHVVWPWHRGVDLGREWRQTEQHASKPQPAKCLEKLCSDKVVMFEKQSLTLLTCFSHFHFWVMTKTLTKQLQVKSRTGKQERQSCDWNSVQIYQSQRLFGQRLHSFSSHISSVPDPVVTSAFVIYFLSFVTFTGLAFQVCASPFVNNWWWSAACWESKAATGVWAAGTRWQLALTWHTNTHSHTYIWRYESHWLFPHSLPPSLSRLFLHHRK